MRFTNSLGTCELGRTVLHCSLFKNLNDLFFHFSVEGSEPMMKLTLIYWVSEVKTHSMTSVSYLATEDYL